MGRRQETAQVKRVLSESRLVTLTGVAGVGKSRLAMHVADGLRRALPDGVWLVELGKVSDPALVGRAVAAALELPDTVSARDPEAVLVDYLADKQLLLVLDNCEHLLDECVRLIGRLIRAAPGLRVLATSREPLRIAGEHVWPVPPLSVPDPEDAALAGESARRYESMALFEDRAMAVRPDFTLNAANVRAVARLCQRLDGLPLAIELAAVWMRTSSVEQVLARVEDRFRLLTTGDRAGLPRHRTLRAAVEWSFDLCSPTEQATWMRLSVFAGDFDIEAAEDVCADEVLPVEDVFVGVTGLVDKSILVSYGEGHRARYRMLETIRQYGMDRLADAGDPAAVRRRHRDYYLRLAERAEAEWFGPCQPEYLDRFGTEEPNLWAALEFSLTQPGEARAGMRMAGLLWWYWIGRAVRDGRYWLDRALAADSEHNRDRARALWVKAWTAIVQGDIDAAFAALAECSALAQELGDDGAAAYAAQWTGTAMSLRKDTLPESLPLLQDAVRRFRASGVVDSVTALALVNLSMAVNMLGDTDRALAVCTECVEVCAAHGERWTRAWALWALAINRWGRRDWAGAAEHVRESLGFMRVLHDRLGIPVGLELLAWAAAVEEDAKRAAFLFGASDTLWEPIGVALFGWQTLLEWSELYRARARGALSEQAFQTAYERGRRAALDDVLARALSEEAEVPAARAPSARERAAASAFTELTPREREVAELAVQGQSNKEIAANLVISPRTVNTHIEHILSKLGFTSRTQIAAWFAEQRK